MLLTLKPRRVKIIMIGKEMEIEKLFEEIRKCRKCELWLTRKNAVPGEGNIKAEIMIVGEAPGRNEDEQGRPFVGKAGQLLNEILEGLGIRREEIFITNIVKCRPPNNRDPTEREKETCSPYLLKQIEIIKPKYIICLGRHSASFLMSKIGMKFSSISEARGKEIEGKINGIEVKIIVTYHPAAALYNPNLRSEIENDLKKLGRKVKKRSLDDYI
jgi:uracil-DNA glycosylase family 4